MRILFVLPGLGACGGLRVLFEHANRLQVRGHKVLIAAANHHRTKSNWFDLRVPTVPISGRNLSKAAGEWDAVVAANPLTLQWGLRVPARRHYWFVQMAEYIFWPEGSDPWLRAVRAYQMVAESDAKVICISKWVAGAMRDIWGIGSEMIDNGVNFDHFRKTREKQGYLLVEGDDRNPAKDLDHIGWKVALELKKRYGLEVYGLAAGPCPYSGIKSVVNPTVDRYSHLYSGALFLIKASKYDARACAPVEAAACGTTTARAIIRGDDDLVDGENCLRVRYDYQELLAAAVRLMENKALRERLSTAASQYVHEHLQWEPVIDRLEELYSG